MRCLEAVHVCGTENGAVGLAEGCEVGLEGEEMVMLMGRKRWWWFWCGVVINIIVVHEFILRNGGGVGRAGEVRYMMLSRWEICLCIVVYGYC